MSNDPTPPRLSYPHVTPPEPGTTIELAPGIHWLRMPLPFPPDHINLWLLADGPRDRPTGWTIVDAGLARDDAKGYWEQIFARVLDGLPVARLIVTHFHPDHMGLAQWLCQRWQAELWMTAGEWYMARSVHANGSPADVAARIAFYRGNGVSPESIGPFAEPNNMYRRGVPEIPPVFRRIAAGVPVEIGGRAWFPIIGRGHAPEHACLWCAELGVLIGGIFSCRGYHPTSASGRTNRWPTRCATIWTRSAASVPCRRTRWSCRRMACPIAVSTRASPICAPTMPTDSMRWP